MALPTDIFEPLIERWLPRYGVAASSAERLQMARYLALVAEANLRIRIVGDAAPDVLVRRHLCESLFLATLAPLAGCRLTDVGSGAGFPGLALALGVADLETTLVESTGKKADLLRAMAAELSLAGRVTVRPARLGRNERRHGEPLAAGWVTVRALEHMELVPSWLGAWMLPGAQAAFWITRTLDAHWRSHYPAWRWSPFHPLPDARERGIVLGVPRETVPMPGA